MGFQDREYMRGSGPRGGFFEGVGGAFPPVIKWLLILNIAIFVLQLLLTRPMQWRDVRERLPSEVVEELEGLSPEESRRLERTPIGFGQRLSYVQEWFELDVQRAVFGGQIWRFVTYAFCHDRGGVWHILINMWVLWLFGPTLERMYGSREFLWFYLAAAVVSGIAFVLLALLFPSGPAIGASGAVIATLMLFAWHYPRHTILIFFVIPVEVRWLVAAYAIFDLVPVLRQLGGDETGDGIAHSAHLGGLAFGLLYGKYGLRLDDFVSRLRLPRRGWGSRARTRRKIRLYEPPRREDLEKQVDAILQKIHDHGEASLTDEERTLLREASRRYKSR